MNILSLMEKQWKEFYQKALVWTSMYSRIAFYNNKVCFTNFCQVVPVRSPFACLPVTYYGLVANKVQVWPTFSLAESCRDSTNITLIPDLIDKRDDKCSGIQKGFFSGSGGELEISPNFSSTHILDLYTMVVFVKFLFFPSARQLKKVKDIKMTQT